MTDRPTRQDAHDLIQAWPGFRDLSVGELFAGGVEALVARVGRGASGRFVLKIGPPKRIAEEYRALRALAGPTLVRVIAWREAAGALLLEEVVPGIPLTQERGEDRARAAFCSVMDGLGSDPGGPSFPSLARWLRDLGPFRHRLEQGSDHRAPWIRAAETVSERLLATASESRLLHGDLHHGNILRAGCARYVGIDPKGVRGDPAFEPSCFLRNRWEGRPDISATLMAEEAGRMAEILHLRPARVLRWTYVHTALSLAWSASDDGWPPDADGRWRILGALFEEGGADDV